MTFRTTTIAFVMLAFSLGFAWPTRAQEAVMAECNGEAEFARIAARDRDAGVPSEKMIATINGQRTLTPDDKLRMTGVATMIYGNRGADAGPVGERSAGGLYQQTAVTMTPPTAKTEGSL